jgi:hypothetical protein
MALLVGAGGVVVEPKRATATTRPPTASTATDRLGHGAEIAETVRKNGKWLGAETYVLSPVRGVLQGELANFRQRIPLGLVKRRRPEALPPVRASFDDSPLPTAAIRILIDQ